VDADLPVMLALQAGEESALNELIARHRDALHHFVYRYVQNETVAADVVQETFVRVYFKAQKYRPPTLVKTWIYAIAVNLCRDHFRRTFRRRGDVPINGGSESVTQPSVDPADAGPSPSTLAGQSEEFAALKNAIDELPHALKTALILFTLEGHSQKEAAEILGTTPKTVELRVYRAKDRLKKALSGLLGG
jgi:RNA polymerase sigma-70 factor (ECF subfamily)